MSYEIFQFNLGTGYAQGYVLVGRGAHEGAECSISKHEMDGIIDMARDRAREAGLPVRAFTLLIERPKPADAPEVGRMVAAEMDHRFLQAWHERQAALSAARETR